MLWADSDGNGWVAIITAIGAVMVLIYNTVKAHQIAASMKYVERSTNKIEEVAVATKRSVAIGLLQADSIEDAAIKRSVLASAERASTAESLQKIQSAVENGGKP